jgi:dCTP deaminase
VTVLSDRDIQAAIDNGDLGISTPRNKEVLIQPSSIDLRLSPSIQVVRSELADGGEFINPTRLNNIQEKLRNLTETLELKHDQPFVLQPGSFVLGTTAERVTLSNKLAARVEGKSSLARFGIAVHLTAPKIDPGWSNNITLEIVNLGPHKVMLEPFMEIAVLIVETLSSPALEVYSGQFNAPPTS